MKKIGLSAVMLASLFTISNLFAQQNPRISVQPLKPNDVSKSEALALSALLEAGFVGTGAYEVIEQEQAAEILKAEEYSMSECTDEACAIEIGKLLAAEQLVLGTVSRIGSKFVITAKLIDVKTGKNLRAENVEAPSIDQLTEQMELLAYKLAGLTVKQTGTESIAKAFGELWLQTDPDGAEVTVNGVTKGNSPILVQRIPLGKAVVEAKKDNLYVRTEIELKDAKLQEIQLKLVVTFGNIVFKTNDKTLKVYLDGKYLQDVGSGLVKSVAVGEHDAALRGTGLLWAGKVKVTVDQTTTVDAYPREVGRIVYTIPTDASMDISGPGLQKTVKGTGKAVTLEDVFAGDYVTVITGANYKELRPPTLSVRKGTTTTVAPTLQFTDDYLALLARQKRDAEYGRLQGLVGGVESRLSNSSINTTDLNEAEAVSKQVTGSEYRFDDLSGRATSVVLKLKSRVADQELQARIQDLTGRRDSLKSALADKEKSRGTMFTSSLVSLGIGGASLIGMGVALILERVNLAAYNAATTTSATSSLRQTVESMRIVTYATGGAGGVGLIVSGILALLAPPLDSLPGELKSTQAELDGLQAGKK